MYIPNEKNLTSEENKRLLRKIQKNTAEKLRDTILALEVLQQNARTSHIIVK